MQHNSDQSQIEINRINNALSIYQKKIKAIEEFIQKKQDTSNLSTVREEIKEISEKK